MLSRIMFGIVLGMATATDCAPGSSAGFDANCRPIDAEEQNRYSIIYQYAPIGFAQFRLGARIRDGIPQNELQNSDFYFVQLNTFF
jgi:hypothetical protein